MCNVVKGLLCDPLHEDNLIIEVTHLQTVSDCQALCQNHPECNFWSHYNEEGGEHWWDIYMIHMCDHSWVNKFTILGARALCTTAVTSQLITSAGTVTR